MTLAEYMRELILMRRQYGQEEELYPLINKLLRESNNVKEKSLSVRTVASGRTGVGEEKKVDHIVRNMLFGYASFPDLVIADENYNSRIIEDKNDDDVSGQNKLMYGCVEAKALGKKILEIDNDCNFTIKFNYTDYLRIAGKPQIGNREECARVECKSEKAEEIDNLLIKYKSYEKINCSDIENIINSQIVINEENYIEALKIPKKDYEDFYMDYLRDIKIEPVSESGETIDALKKSINAYGLKDKKQLFGELIWYGKVLYTNGIIWEYFEIDKNQLNQNRLINECFWGNADWIRIISEKPIPITYRRIGDLSLVFGKILEEYENAEKMPSTGEIDVYLKEIDKDIKKSDKNKEELVSTKIAWDNLIEGLNGIQWKKPSDSDQ